MTPLQKARAKWLDAERKLIDACAENQRLKIRCYELESKLIVSAGEKFALQLTNAMYAPFVFAGKPNATAPKEDVGRP